MSTRRDCEQRSPRGEGARRGSLGEIGFALVEIGLHAKNAGLAGRGRSPSNPRRARIGLGRRDRILGRERSARGPRALEPGSNSEPRSPETVSAVVPKWLQNFLRPLHLDYSVAWGCIAFVFMFSSVFAFGD